MKRCNEELLIENLNLFRDSMIKRYSIEDEYFLDEIESVLMELIEFGCYIDFDVERFLLFDKDELLEFVEFYKKRDNINTKVPINVCIEIVEMLFEENLYAE